MAESKPQMLRMLGHLSEALVKTCAALHEAKADHTIIGAVALAQRGPVRYTEDVDLLVDPGRWKQANAAMRRAGFVRNPESGFAPAEYLSRFIDPDTHAGVDLLFGAGDPEESAREDANKAVVLGTRCKVAKPEYLVWLYLLSDDPQHQADAVKLLATGAVDVPRLRRLLNLDNSERELWPRLHRWIIEAEILRRRGHG